MDECLLCPAEFRIETVKVLKSNEFTFSSVCLVGGHRQPPAIRGRRSTASSPHSPPSILEGLRPPNSPTGNSITSPEGYNHQGHPAICAHTTPCTHGCTWHISCLSKHFVRARARAWPHPPRHWAAIPTPWGIDSLCPCGTKNTNKQTNWRAPELILSI